MDRYNQCNNYQKKILDTLYVYLGFNEVASFEEYIKYMFFNTKDGIVFIHVLNHTLAHIATLFKQDFPEYKDNYIQYLWLEERNAISHFSTGSDIEYDPKGLLRYYVKNHFRKLVATKR